MKIFKRWFILNIIFIICVIPFKIVCAYEKSSIKEERIYTINDDYVYSLSKDGVEIIDITDYEDMNFVCKLKGYNMENNNLHIYNDRLFISGIESYEDKSYIKMIVYDVYDKKNLIKLKEFKFEGYEYLFIKNDGMIYLVIQESDSKGRIISIDLTKKDIDLNADYFEGGEISFIYSSDNNLYVICNEDMIGRYFTTIHKFDISEGIKYVNKISFDGVIYNDKFIHEYDGNLRVLAKCENFKNKIYILDKDFRDAKCVDVILENENINNVYFDKEMCYISGFLKEGYFSIYNLKHSNPKEMGRIKLTSSSDYIYKLNEDKFIVVGNEYRTDTYKNMQSDKVFEVVKNTGIKINLIDVLDKNNPKIFDEYFIKGKEVCLSEFLDEEKMLFSRDKNILAFTLDISGYSMDMDINTAMEVNSDFNCEGLSRRVYIFDLHDKDKIFLKFMVKCGDELFGNKNVRGIKIYNEDIFIFLDNCFKVFNLEGKLLGEYTFIKKETN